MRSLLLLIIVSVLAGPGLSFAEPFKPVRTPLNETSKREFTITGAKGKKRLGMIRLEKFPSTLDQKIEIISRDGSDYYLITENTELFNKQQIHTTTLIAIGDYLKAISHSLLRTSPDGEVIEKWEFRFDHPSWNYSDDTYPLPAMTLLFRSFLDHQMEENTFNLWQNDQAVVGMKFKSMGQELIEIPLGELSCFKIRMMVDIRSIMPVGRFVAALIQPFLPQSYFWMWEKENFLPLRTQIALGPGGAPQLVGEVFEYKTAIPRTVETEFSPDPDSVEEKK